MQEAEQMIRPLEGIFDRRSIENLRNAGVKGVIPLKISIEELLTIAERNRFEWEWLNSRSDPKKQIGMYWIQPGAEGEAALVFYTKDGDDGKTVYVLDDEFERFKELFLQ